NIFHRFSRSKINGNQFRAVGWSAQDFAIKHVWPRYVRRISVRTGDKIATVGSGDWRAKHFPFFYRRDGNIGGDGALEQFGGLFAGSEIGIAEAQFDPWDECSALAHFYGTALDAPAFAGKLDEEFSRRGGALPHRWHRS